MLQLAWRLKTEGSSAVSNNTCSEYYPKSKMRVTEKFHRLKDIQKFLLQYKESNNEKYSLIDSSFEDEK